jgi:SAUR family protein
MALAAWRRKNTTTEAAVQSRYFILASAGGGDNGRTPKGYVPILLVGDDHEGNGGAEERVLVNVAMLKEPCMEGLLEMAAQQFGYGQQGVLRIPCDARQFHQMMVSVHSKSR